MEVERTKGSNTAEASEPNQEIAPIQASQEARKRRFHALLPSTENPSRHRQLSRPPGYLSLPRASDFFYDTPGSTAAGEPRNGTTTVTSQASPQTEHVPPGPGWERATLGPQGEGGRAMEVERTQSSNTAELRSQHRDRRPPGLHGKETKERSATGTEVAAAIW